MVNQMKVKALIVGKAIAEEMCKHEHFVLGEKDLHSGVKRLGTIDTIPLYLDPLLKPGKMLISHVYEEGDEPPEWKTPDGHVLL